MANVFKVLSLLLTYPSVELQQEAPAIKAVLQADKSIGSAQCSLLSALVTDIAAMDIYAAQERYVDLFDRSNARSLHLFEHIHGESRDRGQAMVDLLKMYNDQRFDIGVRELPDYLPLFLEFLSLQSEQEARELLTRILHIVTALHERLQGRKSIYANAFSVMLEMAEGSADQKLVSDILEFPDDDPNDLEALDRVWEEAAVSFGADAATGSNDACSEEQLRTQLRAAKRSAG